MTEIIEADYATDGDSSTKYRYWAFISYAHYDARIAQSLKRRLSGMRVPAELRNTVSTRGSHFSDVFLDVHDAGADRVSNCGTGRGTCCITIPDRHLFTGIP
jgi:hypothetical protein